MARVRIVGLVLATALVVAFILFVFASRTGGEGGKASTTIYIADCGSGLTSLVKKAAEAASPALACRVVSVGPTTAATIMGSHTILVVDADACKGEEYGLLLARSLEASGVVVLVGFPENISRLIKSQHYVLMAYPLPRVDTRIIYVVSVAGYTVTSFNGVKGLLVTPIVKYWKGVNTKNFVEALHYVCRLVGR